MSEPKFTPGPWVVHGRRVGPLSKEDDQTYGMIVPTVCYVEEYDSDDYEANAYLIAAAPELYEALEEFVCTASKPIVDSGKYHEAWVKAKAALAKARGEG